MSENSPRWPGSNGSPGLDFSPYRTSGVKDQENTEVTPAVQPAPKPGAHGFTPTVSQRAATTAKEWAAVPVTGAPAHPEETAEMQQLHPVTPPKAADAPAARPEVTPAPRPRSSRRTRKARLRLSRIDPWSVMKTTLLFSIAFGIMMLVVVFVLWSVLAGSGALESANTLINTVLGDAENSEASFKLEDYLTVNRVMGFAIVIAVVDAVIITAVATLFAFLYNLAATVMGGLEVTLAED